MAVAVIDNENRSHLTKSVIGCGGQPRRGTITDTLPKSQIERVGSISGSARIPHNSQPHQPATPPYYPNYLSASQQPKKPPEMPDYIWDIVGDEVVRQQEISSSARKKRIAAMLFPPICSFANLQEEFQAIRHIRQDGPLDPYKARMRVPVRHYKSPADVPQPVWPREQHKHEIFRQPLVEFPISPQEICKIPGKHIRAMLPHIGLYAKLLEQSDEYDKADLFRQMPLMMQAAYIAQKGRQPLSKKPSTPNPFSKTFHALNRKITAITHPITEKLSQWNDIVSDPATWKMYHQQREIKKKHQMQQKANKYYRYPIIPNQKYALARS